MIREFSISLILALALLDGSTAMAAAADASANIRKSDSSDRESIGLTIYNSNRALVSEVRRVKLPDGLVELWFQDVAASIMPETVAIRRLSGASFSVLEQNYEYDLLSPQKLLEKYLDHEVVLVRYRREKETTIEDRTLARLLSTNNGTVWQVEDRIIVNPPYAYLEFPELPENLYSRPTLVWLLDAQSGEARVRTSYLTGDMTWQADYVFTLSADDSQGDLLGWVTIDNRSGAHYENASLKLIAGDVRTVGPELLRLEASRARAVADETGFREKEFFEYHLYTLQRPATLNDRQQKQIELLRAPGFGVEKEFILRGQRWYYRREQSGDTKPKVAVAVRIENSAKNGLGMPLPKGTVRVYKNDDDGSALFIGEDKIDHTPKDEEIVLTLGNAFDVAASRKQTDYRIVRKCVQESAYEISLRNHKKDPIVVRVIEPVGGDWKILTHTHPYEKKDAFTVEFPVLVEANAESILTYRVRSKFCD
ncbi:MAG: DUF4139 domain-containing protein [Acidobacteriota bacterium]